MKLKFFIGGMKSDGYSEKYRLYKGTERGMVIGFKHSMRKIAHNPIYQGNQEEMIKQLNDRNGYIRSKIRFGKCIMMMDVDHKDFKDETSAALEKDGIAHTVIESSEGKYWIIADTFRPNRWIMAEEISYYTGVDPDYIRYSRKRGFCLRAFPTNGFVPEIIDQVGKGSKDYSAFIWNWKQYWEKPHIKWMVQEYLMNVL